MRDALGSRWQDGGSKKKNPFAISSTHNVGRPVDLMSCGTVPGVLSSAREDDIHGVRTAERKQHCFSNTRRHRNNYVYYDEKRIAK